MSPQFLTANESGLSNESPLNQSVVSIIRDSYGQATGAGPEPNE